MMQPALLDVAMVGLYPLSVDDANELVVGWDHNLGPCNRPFHQEAFYLAMDGQPIAVAISASMVGAHIVANDGTVFRRGETVELARQAAGNRWANRVMIRLWREACAPRWPCWPVVAGISYSQNARHAGDLYRFDGWEKASETAGSSGGGSWSRPRYATDAVHGKKTVWIWRYPETAKRSSAPK